MTSTLKDYRPPPKTNGLSIYQNGSLEKNPRLASTIYKCLTCTKGFVSQEILENHTKIHAETTSVTQSVSSMMTEPKIMSEKLVSYLILNKNYNCLGAIQVLHYGFLPHF